MTDKILEEIFFEYQELVRNKNNTAYKASQLKEKLIEKLDDNDIKTLLSLLEAYSEIEADCSMENFKSGFRTGCRFMLDVLKV